MNTVYVHRPFGSFTAGVVVLVLALTACDSATDSKPADSSAAGNVPAVPVAGGEALVSIDADGNIAPFGFASREPVPVPELAATAAAADATTAVAATSTVFATHCAACHGPDAKGVEGLGVSLVESKLVADSAQPQLIEFLQEGRALDAPDNVTGIPMPSFAWMTEADLAEVSAYLKSMNPG